jgi:hypothetical protein
MKHVFKKMTALCLLCASVLTTQLAHADLVTFDFTGTYLADSYDVPGDFFRTQQAITGSFTFDPSFPQSGSDLSQPLVNYDNVVSFSVNFGGYLLAPNGDGSMLIGNDIPEEGVNDSYQVSLPPVGSVAGLSFTSVNIALLQYFANDALTSTAVPLTPPDISKFSLRYIEFGAPYFIRATLDSLTVSPVPEPSESILYLSGLVMIGMIRWQMRRHNVVAHCCPVKLKGELL